MGSTMTATVLSLMCPATGACVAERHFDDQTGIFGGKSASQPGLPLAAIMGQCSAVEGIFVVMISLAPARRSDPTCAPA